MRIALGTVQFGISYGIANQTGKIPQETVKSMLDLAAANGIEVLDTAIAYGDSEAVLGRLGVKDFRVVTKLPAVPSGCTDVGNWVHEQVDASRHRLGIETLYGLLLHRPDQLLGPFGKVLYQSLGELKEEGKTQKIGISIYSPKELDLLVPKFQFDLIQAPFNLIDRRLQKSGWLNRLKEQGVEVHTRSSFLQGLILIPYSSFPKKFEQWGSLWKLKDERLSSFRISPLQACMSFSLSISEIDHVVIGADNLEQLKQIIDASKKSVPDIFSDLDFEDEKLINPSHWDSL